jgi:hypothetical protein
MAVIYGSSVRQFVRNGLIGYWDAANSRSYPGSGTTWSDLSGNGVTGTLYNGPTYSAGTVSFDGTNDYFQTSAITGVNTSAITHCCLFRVSTLPTTTSCIFGGSNQLIQGIRISPSGGNILLSGQYSISFSNYATANFTGSLNTWYFITTCWTSGGTIKMYQNGTLLSQSSSASGTLSAYDAHTMAKYSTTEYTPATISVAGVYNRELSSTEINNNYNAIKDRYNV